MRVSPQGGLDPRWYEQTETLSPNAAHDFPNLVRRVRRFNRDSLALMTSGCNWYSWSLRPGKPDSSTGFHFVLGRYSLFVALLSFVFSPRHGAKSTDEVDLRLLTGELYEIGGLERDANWYKSHEVEPLRLRLAELAESNPYLQKIDFGSHADNLMNLLYMSRVALVQWEGFTFSTADWMRSILIYEKYREIAIERRYVTPAEIETAENRFLGTTLQRFMRSVMFIIAWFASTHTNKSQPPRPLRPETQTLPDELADKFQADDIDLKIVADRLAINASELRRLSTRFAQAPPKAWLLVQEMWTLHDFPIVRIDDEAPHSLLLSLAPDRLIPRAAKLLLHDIVSFFEVNNILRAANRAYNVRGEALEYYVAERGGDLLRRPEAVLPASYQGKRPDFIWEGDRWNLLIEVKSNIRMNADRTYFNSASLADTWNILTEAIDQGREFLQATGQGNKRHCLVILTSDNLCEPLTNFKHVAKFWNFLAGTGLSSLAMLSLSSFEEALQRHTADAVAENLQGIWDRLEPFSIQAQLLDYEFFSANDHPQDIPVHIATKWQELFPHFEMNSPPKEKPPTETRRPSAGYVDLPSWRRRFVAWDARQGSRGIALLRIQSR